MERSKNYKFPSKIICLTEESVESLFLLGYGHLVVGASAFVKRPKEALKIPKISFFTSSNYSKILDLNPDLIIGYSDIQKDIARDLIERGQNVYISNHRSLDEILDYIHFLARIVGDPAAGNELITKLNNKIKKAQEFAKTLQKKPKVYFEEWDDPVITGIRWVSELIELCGGIDINREKSHGFLAKERFVSHDEIIEKNPDIIFGCWCGKKVKVNQIIEREGFDTISAVQAKRVYELEPEILLQPGPAPILDGIDILMKYFKQVNEELT